MAQGIVGGGKNEKRRALSRRRGSFSKVDKLLCQLDDTPNDSFPVSIAEK